LTGWLLDTNVLSAFGPGKRPLAAETVAWFDNRAESLYLSTVTAAEIEAGIAKLRRTGSVRRADNLDEWLDRVLHGYAERVLPFDLPVARIAGVLDDAARAIGRHPGFPDVAIAATAQSRELVVLTTNTRHFEPLGVSVLNPFAVSD
jgi:predicted nucleic acid-binding protein